MTLKTIINSEPGNYLKQQIAMYMISFYMFKVRFNMFLKYTFNVMHLFFGNDFVGYTIKH